MSIQSNLENAANGLMMMSESDYPFEYFSTEDTVVNENLALKLAGQLQSMPVQTITLEHLLRNMTDPIQGSVTPQTAVRFQYLAAMLQHELQNLTVYRIGEVQVDVLIMGITMQGNVAGMRTKLIET